MPKANSAIDHRCIAPRREGIPRRVGHEEHRIQSIHACRSRPTFYIERRRGHGHRCTACERDKLEFWGGQSGKLEEEAEAPANEGGGALDAGVFSDSAAVREAGRVDRVGGEPESASRAATYGNVIAVLAPARSIQPGQLQ